MNDMEISVSQMKKLASIMENLGKIQCIIGNILIRGYQSYSKYGIQKNSRLELEHCLSNLFIAFKEIDDEIKLPDINNICEVGIQFEN